MFELVTSTIEIIEWKKGENSRVNGFFILGAGGAPTTCRHLKGALQRTKMWAEEWCLQRSNQTWEADVVPAWGLGRAQDLWDVSLSIAKRGAIWCEILSYPFSLPPRNPSKADGIKTDPMPIKSFMGLFWGPLQNRRQCRCLGLEITIFIQIT